VAGENPQPQNKPAPPPKKNSPTVPTPPQCGQPTPLPIHPGERRLGQLPWLPKVSLGVGVAGLSGWAGDWVGDWQLGRGGARWRALNSPREGLPPPDDVARPPISRGPSASVRPGRGTAGSLAAPGWLQGWRRSNRHGQLPVAVLCWTPPTSNAATREGLLLGGGHVSVIMALSLRLNSTQKCSVSSKNKK